MCSSLVLGLLMFASVIGVRAQISPPVIQNMSIVAGAPTNHNLNVFIHEGDTVNITVNLGAPNGTTASFRFETHTRASAAAGGTGNPGGVGQFPIMEGSDFATRGVDFNDATVTVSRNGGNTAPGTQGNHTISISTIDDSIAEFPEVILCTIENYDNGPADPATPDVREWFTITILDDDSPPEPRTSPTMTIRR